MKRAGIPAVISGVLVWFIQAGWYTAFAAPYIQGLGWTPEQVQQAQQNMTFAPYAIALVCNIILAAVLGWALDRMGDTNVAAGIKSGAILAIGLVITTIITNAVFQLRPWTFIAVIAGMPLVQGIVSGALMGWWLGRGSAQSRSAAASA